MWWVPSYLIWCAPGPRARRERPVVNRQQGGVQCRVYRSPRRAEMYLFVSATEDLARVPEELLARFGKPELALVFELVPGRILARARADDILAALRETGWFLQLPPSADTVAASVAARNEKLPRGF